MSLQSTPLRAAYAATSPDRQQAWYENFLERGRLPDWLVRAGIRRMCAARLAMESAGGPAAQHARKLSFLEEMARSPIALETRTANQQHYEVPSEFFQNVLGHNLKYSSAYWPDGIKTLDRAENAMLELYCERARLADGQHILELGCGWGSLSLFLAARYPNSRITGVSNSRSQKEWIETRARERGIGNLHIVTADMNQFQAEAERYDRVVSIEMLEHMRNWPRLLERVAGWMKPNALMFIHIFTHRKFAYPYEVLDSSDWMAQHFFTGGMMPSEDLLTFFQDDLRFLDQWSLSGLHYEKTANAWLANMDARRGKVMPLLARTYGPDQALRWWVRWRVFFMACAELWGYKAGREWRVSHYLLQRR